VVGNPANTNCMIAASQAKRLPADRFTAMVRLDQNRAQAQLAKKAGVDLTAVSDIFIYGNHSPSMFPAFTHAKINGQPAASVINDAAWLQGAFCETVGKRGAAIIAARGSSSAASAANALVDHVRSLVTPGAIHSVGVKSNGVYGFDPEIWAGMPVRTTTAGSYEVITGYAMDDFAKSKIAATNKELVEERAFVADMIT
jgi:malate dehydrogenase